MSDRPNIPVPDELAQVRDQIRDLTAREEELRRLLLNNPDLREGAAYLAEIKTTQQERLDQTLAEQGRVLANEIITSRAVNSA